MKRYALAVIFTVLHITLSYGDDSIDGLEIPSQGYLDGLGVGGGFIGNGGGGSTLGNLGNLAGMGLGFGGNEIPVRDSAVRSTTAAELLRLISMLADMIKQARLGELDGSGVTRVYLEAQAEDRIGEALTYGSNGSEHWPETFRFDHVITDGTWNEAEQEREKQVLDTHQTMLRLLERRHQAFEEDEEKITELIDRTNDAQGRNELLARQAEGQIELIQQQRKTQQLLMTLANTLTVQHGREVNEVTQQRAQEKHFMTSGGKRTAFPTWIDRGL